MPQSRFSDWVMQLSSRGPVQRIGLILTLHLSLCAVTIGSPPSLPTPYDQKVAVSNILPAVGAGCKTSTMVAYDMRGFWYPATVRACQDTIEDVSSGAYAPAPGQKLFLIPGRAQRGSLYTLTRALPNKSYEFTRHDRDEELLQITYQPDFKPLWRNTSTAFPVVPYSTMTYEADGYTYYAFSDLKILPGREAAAYPLTSDSVIIAIDGYPFASPDGFIGLLTGDPAYKQYVEVIYIQKSERPQTARRAFIPRLSLAANAAAWNRMTADSHIGEVDRFGKAEAAALAVFTFAAIAYGFEESGLAQALREQQAECHRRQQAGGAYVIC